MAFGVFSSSKLILPTFLPQNLFCQFFLPQIDFANFQIFQLHLSVENPCSGETKRIHLKPFTCFIPSNANAHAWTCALDLGHTASSNSNKNHNMQISTQFKCISTIRGVGNYQFRPNESKNMLMTLDTISWVERL